MAYSGRLAGLLTVLFLFSSCDKVDEGIDAYYAGDFRKAVKLLEPAIRHKKMLKPEFELWTDNAEELERPLKKITHRYFEVWHAYSGSRLAREEFEEGCRSMNQSLKPFPVTVNNRVHPEPINPREGDFWQAEVMTLRVWWDLFCAETPSSESALGER